MYTLEIKNLILSIYSKLKSLRQVQAITNISKSTISRWVNNITTSRITNKKYNIPVIIDTINLISQSNPFYTINDVQSYLQKQLNIKCSYSLIRCIMMKNLKLSYKKTKFANFLNETSLIYKTRLFHDTFLKLYSPSKLIACIDEVGFSSNLNPIQSWSKKGQKTYIKHKLDTKNKSVCEDKLNV